MRFCLKSASGSSRRSTAANDISSIGIKKKRPPTNVMNWIQPMSGVDEGLCQKERPPPVTCIHMFQLRLAISQRLDKFGSAT